MSASVQSPARTYVGTTAEVAVAIAQTGAARARQFDVIGEWSGPIDPPQMHRAKTESDGGANLTFSLAARRRGVIAIAAVWLRWRGPLALIERRRRFAVDKRIEILPDIRGIHANALNFVSREEIDGIKTQPQKGEGGEFEALRDHAPGLDNRFIDWKHSAKHRKLLSKEFTIERNHQAVIAFDTGRLMSEPIGRLTQLDHAIHAGLQLGWISLRHGDLVGLFGFDARVRQYQPPARGARHFVQLQRATSELVYHTQETNFTLGLAELNARLKRRALVILFTEFVDTTMAELLIESVQRIANRHAVVFAVISDPLVTNCIHAPPRSFRSVAEALVAREFSRERAIVLERLARIGVQCLETPANALSAGLVNRYLTIKQRGLL